MLVKTDDNNTTIVEYPYTVGQLRRDNPSVSFPKQIQEATLNAYNVYYVENQPLGQPAANQIAEWGGNPVKNSDGVWEVPGTLRTRNSDEEAMVATNVRKERDDYLTASDWTQVADSPLSDEVKATWATYRQSLRDLTTHVNFPYLAEEDWPTKPS